MLSEREKAEMLEMAASAEIRETSERLRKAAQPRSPKGVDFDAYLDWLASMAGFGPALPDEPHRSYETVLL